MKSHKLFEANIVTICILLALEVIGIIIPGFWGAIMIMVAIVGLGLFIINYRKK